MQATLKSPRCLLVLYGRMAMNLLIMSSGTAQVSSQSRLMLFIGTPQGREESTHMSIIADGDFPG